MIHRATIAIVVAAMLGACGGGVTQHDSGDGGAEAVDSSTGCAPLAACCATLTGAEQSLCNAVVGVGNAQDCATELGQLRAAGQCAPRPGSDGGDAGDSSVEMNPDAEMDVQSADAPATCMGVTCTPPLACNVLPGSTTATCGPKCQADSDCPAWTTCQSGSCSAKCSTCPAGQTCQGVTNPSGHQCTSNTSCGLGEYCQGGMCSPYEVCTECVGGCPSCASNNQCILGEVCVGNQCVTCTSSSQCGPTATCASTHTGMQCTCTVNGDCASPETCAAGICTVTNPPGCNPPEGCPTGQGCVNNTCGACSTFGDCNQSTFGPQPLPGLVCIAGVCTACTASSQCGGGMACVGGTCGTCATNAQCGASGQCTDGFCTCTGDQQCGTGQRCGGGVCVPM